MGYHYVKPIKKRDVGFFLTCHSQCNSQYNSQYNSQRKRGFTLVELIIALVVFSVIFTTLVSLFMSMIRMKTAVEARQTLLQQTHAIVEKLNTYFQDYTIDYEEYFNRQMVGCNLNTQTTNPLYVNYPIAEYFTWNVNQTGGGNFASIGGGSGNCDTWTAYGNRTAKLDPTYQHIASSDQHKLYTCSLSMTPVGSFAGTNNDERLVVAAATMQTCPREVAEKVVSSSYFAAGVPGYQPYGQYKSLFVDVREDADDKPGRAGDDDDTNIGVGPVALRDNTNVQELYLISQDKKKRVFFRRRLVSTKDYSANGSIDSDVEKRYVIQMLQLKSFDAGYDHVYGAGSATGEYDGVKDTRACDADAGFTCTGPTLGTVYSGYNLPAHGDDGWITITPDNISVADRRMTINPVKDPKLSWGEQAFLMNPFVTLYIKTAMYGQNRFNKIGKSQIQSIIYDLQTSFNVKTNYR